MRFIIRYLLSDLEEEIYEFEIKHSSIHYVGFWLSKRRNLEEPFGYDWSEFYRAEQDKELEQINKKYEDVEGYYHPIFLERKEVFKKYNPVEQRLLFGHYSSSVAKDHPLKVTKEEVMQKALSEVSGLEIK